MRVTSPVEAGGALAFVEPVAEDFRWFSLFAQDLQPRCEVLLHLEISAFVVSHSISALSPYANVVYPRLVAALTPRDTPGVAGSDRARPLCARPLRARDVLARSSADRLRWTVPVAHPRLALARFFVQIGSRLAIAASAPLAAAGIGWLGVQQAPSAALRALALSLFGPQSGNLAGLVPALLGLILAGWAAPRIEKGMQGWIRHLPVSRRDLDAGATIALVVAQAPIAIALVALTLVATLTSHNVAWVRVASIPLTIVAAAMCVRQGGRRWASASLAIAGLVMASTNAWPSLLVAAIALGAAEAVTASGSSIHRARPDRRHVALGEVALRITLRALGLRALTTYLGAAVPVGAVLLFLHNNELDRARATAAVRLGIGLAIAFLVASLAERLAVRRPVWPWARSLPWSARHRVLHDTLVFGAATIPILAVGAWLAPWALPPLGAHAALVSVGAAGALRRAAERRMGAAGEVLAVGAMTAALLSLVPWLAIGALALVPLALRGAANRDQTQHVSAWLERHHQGSGDSLSWSA